jgi:hypothetical protein
MYAVQTIFTKYHSKVNGDSLISSHPTGIKLSTGHIVKCDQETRLSIMEQTEEPFLSGYFSLGSNCKFKIVREWDNDCDSTGSVIRWWLPAKSELIY